MHVNGAYVSLQLKDHVMALHMSQQVLSPQLGGVVVSPALMYLARLYCAEVSALARFSQFQCSQYSGLRVPFSHVIICRHWC